MAKLSGARAATRTRCAVGFQPGDPPRTGRLVGWDPDRGELTRVSVAEAVPALLLARHDEAASRATAFWGEVAAVAMRLIARGRKLPGVSADGRSLPSTRSPPPCPGPPTSMGSGSRWRPPDGSKRYDSGSPSRTAGGKGCRSRRGWPVRYGPTRCADSGGWR